MRNGRNLEVDYSTFLNIPLSKTVTLTRTLFPTPFVKPKRHMKILKQLLPPLLIFLLSFFIQYGIGYLVPLNENLQYATNKIGGILLIMSIAWALIALLKYFKKRYFDRMDANMADNLEARKIYTKYTVLENIVIFLIILIAVGFSLMLFDQVRQIGVSLFASAGVAGIILGFAAQRIIATILAGLQIAFTQPIRLDDVVIVEGEFGRVEEINLTYVVVRVWDKRRLVVPSTYFIENTFQNWTRTTSEILGTVYLYTDYTVPIKAIRDELARVLETTNLWDKQTSAVQVTDAKENTVEIRILLSAINASTAWDLRVYVREKMIEFLQKNYPNSLPKQRLMIENVNGSKKMPEVFSTSS